MKDLWSQAPADDRYSSSFDGYLQTLDHVLVTKGLRKDVSDMRYVHFGNDYYQRTPEDGSKVSDHDPPLVTLAIPSKVKKKVRVVKLRGHGQRR